MKCWAHNVFTRKSWNCLRHPRKAQISHRCPTVTVEEVFHHPTGKPGVIPRHRLRHTRDFLLAALWVKESANSPRRPTNNPVLKTAAALSCGSLCQQSPPHFIQTSFSRHRRCPSGQEDAEILRLLGEIFVLRAKRDIQQAFAPVEQITLCPGRWWPGSPCLPLQPSFELTGEMQRHKHEALCT